MDILPTARGLDAKEKAMNLGEQFRGNVHTATPDEPLRDVVGRMKQKNIGAVVVVADQAKRAREIVGIVTDRDVALALGTEAATVESPVSEVMTRKVVTIWEDEGIFNATQYFLGHQIRRLPIVNHDNQLVGIVTFDDLLALLTRELYNISKAVAPALPEQESVLEHDRLVGSR
jgi:CBS domain-containing protein